MPTHTVEEHVASLTVKMLRARLEKEGRSTKGLKDQLADRLLAALRAKKKSIQKNSYRSVGNVAALCGVSKATERQLLKDARYKQGSHTLCVPMPSPRPVLPPSAAGPPTLPSPPPTSCVRSEDPL